MSDDTTRDWEPPQPPAGDQPAWTPPTPPRTPPTAPPGPGPWTPPNAPSGTGGWTPPGGPTPVSGPGPWAPPGAGPWTPQSGPPGAAYWPPTPAPRNNTNRVVLIVVGVVVVLAILIVALAAVLIGAGLGNVGQRTPLENVAVGQCFDGIKASDFSGSGPQVSSGMLFGVTVVDCAEPHESELGGRVTWPATRGDAYPGDAAMELFAFNSCTDAFLEYVGLDFQQSLLNMTYIYPQQRSWNEGTRTSECLIHPPAGVDKEAGTARNSNR